MKTRPYYYDMPKVADCGSELALQKACRDRIARTFIATRLIAVPNGGKRTRWQRVQAKMEGMTAGFPDLIAIGDGGRIAFVEIKSDSAVSKEQHQMLSDLAAMGFNAGVFRSQDTLAAKLREWGFK